MACAADGGDILRIVLLGKTGAGKSTLGNALLGKKPSKASSKTSKGQTDGFVVGRGLKSETRYCNWDTAVRFGTTIEVTDTPGLCDTHLDNELIYKELAKSVAVTTPGPNIILLALRCDRPFTDEEYSAYLKIKQIFSDAIDSFLIVIFNGLDNLGEDDPIEEQRKALEEEFRKCGKPLDEVIRLAQNRYFGMNNKAAADQMESQAEELIKFMKDLVRKNEGGYFKTEMIEKITRRVEEMVREEAANKQLSLTQARNKVKEDIIEEKVSSRFWDFAIQVITSVASNLVVEGLKKMCSVM